MSRIVAREQDDERSAGSRMMHTDVEEERPLAPFRFADFDARCFAIAYAE